MQNTANSQGSQHKNSANFDNNMKFGTRAQETMTIKNRGRSKLCLTPVPVIKENP